MLYSHHQRFNAPTDQTPRHLHSSPRASREILGLLSTVAIAATLGLSLLLAPGCIFVARGGSTSYSSASATSTRVVTAVHLPNSPLDVSTENGSIDVTTVSGDQVLITAHIRARTSERADRVAVEASRNPDNTLTIRVVWPDGRKSSEGASLLIQIPNASHQTLRTSNGSVSIKNLDGDVIATTGNGSITTQGHRGGVIARTSNGDVDLSGASSADVDTSNGTVRICFTQDAQGPFNIETSNGGVELNLAGFQGRVEAETSNGSVSVQAPNAVSVHTTPNQATLQLGDLSTTAKVKTSNGTITICS